MGGGEERGGAEGVRVGGGREGGRERREGREREWDGERGKRRREGICYHIAESATNQFDESLAMWSRFVVAWENLQQQNLISNLISKINKFNKFNIFYKFNNKFYI